MSDTTAVVETTTTETLPTDAATSAEAPTTPAPDASAAAQAAPADAAAAAAEAEKPAAPVYEFVAPEGITLDAALVDAVTPIFAEANVAPEQAQKLVDAYAKHQAEMFTQQVAAWESQAKADAEIGGAKLTENTALSKRVLHQFGAESFTQFLNETGLGSHPEMIRMLSKIGRATSEDTTIRSSSAAAPQPSAGSQLYPSMPNE